MIRTTDTAWTREHASPGREPATAIITIPDDAERIMLAGMRFYGIDLKALCGSLPAGCLNRWVAIPERHILEGAADG